MDLSPGTAMSPRTATAGSMRIREAPSPRRRARR
jgi:hypothetical protein